VRKWLNGGNTLASICAYQNYDVHDQLYSRPTNLFTEHIDLLPLTCNSEALQDLAKTNGGEDILPETTSEFYTQ
jgi:hypothetical protein